VLNLHTTFANYFTDAYHKKSLEQEIIRHNKEIEKINAKKIQGSIFIGHLKFEFKDQ